MSTRSLIDPELLAALETFGAGFDFEALPQVRALAAELVSLLSEGADLPGVVRSERLIQGPPDAPEVRVLVYEPAAAARPRPAILHVHGGGYVMGAPEMNDSRNRAYAAELGCVIVSVDYRLAPETRFPGAVEDCYAALKWLHANARELGVDGARIAVTGESAGGGLAAALALVTRDRGEIPLAFQHLIYPMIDDRIDETHEFVGEFVWTRASNRFGWSALLGGEPGGSDVSPYAAAARAEDLSGLPPTFISVGGLDLFLEENLEYARRLARAGVPVELHVYPRAYHGFHLATEARVTRQAERDQLEALRTALRAPATELAAAE